MFIYLNKLFRFNKGNIKDNFVQACMSEGKLKIFLDIMCSGWSALAVAENILYCPNKQLLKTPIRII